MKTLKEALFSRKNIHKKILNLRSNTIKGTLSIEIANDKASFNYENIHFGSNYNITIVISTEDAKSVIDYLGIKHYKSGENVYDVDNKDNYIYCDPSGKAIVLCQLDQPYDIIFWLDEEQIKELKELFK